MLEKKETNKKFLGWKIGMKNFSRKMERTRIASGKILVGKSAQKVLGRLVEKTGIVHEKLLGRRIVKISTCKIDGTN